MALNALNPFFGLSMRKFFRKINDKSGFLGNYIASSAIKLQYLKKHLYARNYDYTGQTVALAAKPFSLDVAIAFYTRILLGRSYKTVVEIGSYDGSRIIELKKLFSGIHAFGLDILENYKNSPVSGGVEFHAYSTQKLSDIARTSEGAKIILARGTLTCFTTEELEEFIRCAHQNGFDVFILEPETFIKNARSSPRSPISFYHPYSKIFAEHGYEACYDHGDAVKEVSAQHEAWYANLFVADGAVIKG